MSEWTNKGFIEWTDERTREAFLSVVFSWNLQKARERALYYHILGYTVHAGGPAVTLNPGYFEDVTSGEKNLPDAIALHNPRATFTSRGCSRKCSFCAVPRLEGDLIELDSWPIRPIICDNNLLACSMAHFNRVIDSLKPLSGIDFNQGLDARLLTKEHAERIKELDLTFARLAWDHSSMEDEFLKAYQILRDAKIPKKKIRVYCLIGFNDTPEDALYRLQTIKDLGSRPNPMRYQPLDSFNRNSYVSPAWTEYELKAYMRYWSRLRWLEHIPFEEYRAVEDDERMARIEAGETVWA